MRIQTTWSFALLATLGLLVAGCAKGANELTQGSGAAPPGGAGGGGGDTGFTGGGGGAGGGDWAGLPWSEADCAEPTQFVYVVTTSANLYRFWPPTLSFEHVGHLDCPTDGSWSPLSMAIDRHADAWVLYWDQVVYRLDLASGHCEESGYNPGHQIPGPFGYFGMAFTADAASPEGESLFVRQAAFYDAGSDPGSRLLGRFDTGAMAVSVVGEGPGANTDLAGTGDGRLYGFEKIPTGEGNDLSRLVEYDKSTGEVIASTDLEGVTIGDAWAVAAWGGDIWLFSSTYEGSTSVARYDPEAGTVETVLSNTGFKVLGAGVSSCAPIEPPK